MMTDDDQSVVFRSVFGNAAFASYYSHLLSVSASHSVGATVSLVVLVAVSVKFSGSPTHLFVDGFPIIWHNSHDHLDIDKHSVL